MAEKSDPLQDIRAALAAVREDYWHSLEQRDAVDAEAMREVLVVRMNAEWFGLPGACVREVLRVPPLVRVPGAAAHIAGIISLRGEILTVTDPRATLGMEGVAGAAQGRLVVVGVNELCTALLVDEVRDLRAIAEACVELPSESEGTARPFVLGRVPQEEGLVTLLNVDWILSGARA